MMGMWAIGSFFSGSLMFSYWLGLAARRDVRRIGDGNPGAINLWKAAGAGFGISGIALDFLKGYLPVLFYVRSGMPLDYGWSLVAAAPVLGHLFSPFLKFKGGKGIAVTFGVWSALTAFRVSLALALLLLLLHLVFKKAARGKVAPSDADGFQVVLGVMILPIYLIFAGYPAPIRLFGLVNFGLILFAHRHAVIRFLGFRQFESDRQEEHGRQIGG